MSVSCFEQGFCVGAIVTGWDCVRLIQAIVCREDRGWGWVIFNWDAATAVAVVWWGRKGVSVSFCSVHTHRFSKVKLERPNYKVSCSYLGQYKQQLSVAEEGKSNTQLCAQTRIYTYADIIN